MVGRPLRYARPCRAMCIVCAAMCGFAFCAVEAGAQGGRATECESLVHNTLRIDHSARAERPAEGCRDDAHLEAVGGLAVPRHVNDSLCSIELRHRAQESES